MPESKKYHVLEGSGESLTPEIVKKFIIPVMDVEKRNRPKEGPIRQFQSTGIPVVVSNYPNSMRIFQKIEKNRITWDLEEVAPGVRGGTVEGWE